jgi:hypothetical protein
MGATHLGFGLEDCLETARMVVNPAELVESGERTSCAFPLDPTLSPAENAQKAVSNTK